MKGSHSLRVWECAALTALCLALLAGAWAQGRQERIAGRLLRLHVVAASDAPEEQALKLRVRDAVLETLGPALEGAETRQEAERRVRENLDAVAAAAESAAEGRRVSVSLSRERYPFRQYEGFRLPAGRYQSLRVVLGEGEGRNWWCVVFPPLCLAGAEGESLQSVMGREDAAMLTGTPRYELRFRLLELWGEWTAALDSGGEGEYNPSR